jgi:hypothetical protein
VALEETTMVMALGSKGKEVWWRRGGGHLGPLYRSQKWGAHAPPVVAVVSETTSLMVQN